MILYGGRLSPFVRRVELWLALQDRQVERQYVSAFDADFGGLLAINPLGRVPVLVTDTGENLFETSAIIDYLEETAGERRLIPVEGHERRHLLQTIGLAHGIAEKTVALIYESSRRPEHLRWADWQTRLGIQVTNGLAALGKIADPAGPSLGAVEIVATCAYDLVALKFPQLLPADATRLAAVSKRANSHPVFASTHPTLA